MTIARAHHRGLGHHGPHIPTVVMVVIGVIGMVENRVSIVAGHHLEIGIWRPAEGIGIGLDTLLKDIVTGALAGTQNDVIAN